MEVAEFHTGQLKNPSGAQMFAAHCGSKGDYSSALQFWLWSLQRVTSTTPGRRVFLRAVQEARCEPISSSEYFDIADTCIAGLKHPPDFLLRQNLTGAMKMFSGVVLGDVRTSVLAEFDDAFIAIHDTIWL